MKVAAIIQARMGSTRLPGKILKKVNGKTLLEYQIERIRKAGTIDQIIIATTVKGSDQPIVDFCREKGISYYQGSEQDVLSRYVETAKEFSADVIVRLTSDCPIIDPQVVDQTVGYFLAHQELFDYVSNTIKRTFPRGMDTEVFSYHALQRAHQEAVLERDREHVTAYIYTNPDRFRIQGIENKNDYSHYRLTVDTEEDFELISLIIDKLYSPDQFFYLENVIALLEKHPEWSNINAHIEQKKL
ncbi:cytidylyltransferase domain-containing protein [Domibacillus epiphyticus]|uniref:Acylneuraminate cytidylyltransferase n=1 Tax=Domibacillus epiphyticus TaxID=1714355 RepID=A0A1V2A474_9BACI|nr:glycosyltransferase family protein [Domibacillus epiphyticus]OMP65793.1 acylneuraminate cytidylyltransferase [Domibacillus epiphyticus]